MEHLVIFLLSITFFGIVGMILACIPFKKIYTSLLKLRQRKNSRTFPKVKTQRQEPNLRNTDLFNLNLDAAVKSSLPPEKNLSHPENEFTILYLLSETNAQYKGSVVWHTLLAQKLIYGKMHIFHAYEDSSSMNRKILFSVAGATEPGYLNQANLEGKNISGLCFFMRNDASSNVFENFKKMLRTAQKIHDILGGTLCNHRRESLNKAMIEQYQQRLSSFK